LSSPADHAGSSSTASQVFSLLPRAPTSLLLLKWIASLEEEDTRTSKARIGPCHPVVPPPRAQRGLGRTVCRCLSGSSCLVWSVEGTRRPDGVPRRSPEEGHVVVGRVAGASDYGRVGVEAEVVEDGDDGLAVVDFSHDVAACTAPTGEHIVQIDSPKKSRPVDSRVAGAHDARAEARWRCADRQWRLVTRRSHRGRAATASLLL